MTIIKMSISISVLKIFYNVHIPSNVVEIAALGHNFAYKQCCRENKRRGSLTKEVYLRRAYI